MVLNTVRAGTLAVATIILWVTVWLLWPIPAGAAANDPGHLRPDANEPRVVVESKVESRPDGVYIQISVRRSTPGDRNAGSPPGESPPAAHAGGSPSSGPAGRWWTDVTGIHYRTADGYQLDLIPPNIGSLIGWQAEFASHPNNSPYTLYVNDQFQGIIWIPNTTSGGNVYFGPPPALPAGSGSSTDPLEVALDALGHLPLPGIRIGTNPAIGLVAMPGWFWVEGYDGQPFGTSRTVDIPAEVGPEVPFVVVPADDLRRQGTSFTVEVRAWPTKYQWSFGDGAGLVTQSLGRRYPLESDIQHLYEHSSLRFPNGFPVRLTVEFAAEFRVNGGAPSGLPPISQTYESAYRVQEVQPVLTNQ